MSPFKIRTSSGKRQQLQRQPAPQEAKADFEKDFLFNFHLKDCKQAFEHKYFAFIMLKQLLVLCMFFGHALADKSIAAHHKKLSTIFPSFHETLDVMPEFKKYNAIAAKNAHGKSLKVRQANQKRGDQKNSNGIQ